MTTIWRLTIKPDSEENVDPRKFCIKRNILGVGWQVDRDAPLDWKTYEELGTEKYYNKYPGWWPAVNAIGNRMEINDLCWTRDFDGNYYIGRIKGEWKYRSSSAYRKGGHRERKAL